MNKHNIGLVYTLILCISLFSIACNTTTTTTPDTNSVDNKSTSENSESNSTDSNADKPADETTSNAIDTKEPDSYQGKISLKIEAMGEKGNVSLPTPLEATFAKSAANKRMEFNLPNNQKVVYLELGKKNFVVLPDKKQYAELNEKSTGFQVRSLMTPEQMINQVKSLKGVEKVGDEKLNGRDAVKYKYAAETKTNTKAGEVNTESFIFVDKETGLPLRTELVSTTEQDIKGYKGIKVITEMSDIKTEVSEDLFKEPEDFEKIEEEQIRQQINVVFTAASAFLEQFVKSMTAN